MTELAPLRDRLRAVVDLRIPGFLRSVPPGRVRQITFRERPVDAWFDEFVERVVGAIGRHYLPVFRISDGEFTFSVGSRIPYPPPGGNPVLHYAREVLSYLRWRRFDTFLSGAPGHDLERYRGAEWRRLRAVYTAQLRELARTGLLAVNLVRTPERFGERHHAAFLEWMDRARIPVTEQNCYPFYFVYGLLNSSLRRRVYAGRRLLVVTSLTPAKQQAIESGLRAAGAASVQFRSVSGTRAMCDTVDLSGVEPPIDVVLIGAGVGAANVLTQVRQFGTLAIDAGHCLDLLAAPEVAGQRDYTLPDEELERHAAGRHRDRRTA
ncbi:MAG: hypothetical protein ACJ8AO_21315 [Gemmatimonadaceae bacterium]